MTDDGRSAQRPINDRPHVPQTTRLADEPVRSPDRRGVLRTASTLAAGATLAHALGDAASAQARRAPPLLRPAEPLEIAGFERVRVQDERRQPRSRPSRAASGPPASCCCTARRSRTTPGATSRPSSPRTLHRRRGGPARLRRQQPAAGSARSFELLEARDGAGSSRRHEALRLRLGSPSSARTAAGASRTGWRSIIRTAVTKARAHRHRADVLPLHARDDRIRAGLLPLVQFLASRADARERAARAAAGARALASAAQAEYDARTGRPKASTRCARTIARPLRSTSSTTRPISITKIRCPLNVLWADGGAMDEALRRARDLARARRAT